ncbi:TPA: hypothetical protein ACH3X2_013592 [Trebouxia sp. C0005]
MDGGRLPSIGKPARGQGAGHWAANHFSSADSRIAAKTPAQQGSKPRRTSAGTARASEIDAQILARCQKAGVVSRPACPTLQRRQRAAGTL